MYEEKPILGGFQRPGHLVLPVAGLPRHGGQPHAPGARGAGGADRGAGLAGGAGGEAAEAEAAQAAGWAFGVRFLFFSVVFL